MADFSDISTRSRLVCLKGHLYQWIDENDALVVELGELADNLDEHFNNISKGKVGGATGAIVGGILGVVGFGLSFVTFGASLGLTIAGKSSKMRETLRINILTKERRFLMSFNFRIEKINLNKKSKHR